MKRAPAPALALAAGFLASAAISRADTVPIFADRAAATDGRGSFEGTLRYTPLAANQGSLVIELLNTTDPAAGGYLTGLVFDVNTADPAPRAMQFFALDNFMGVSGADAPPFGTGYVGGSSTFDDGPEAGRFVGGGDPALGLGPGEMGIWDFRIVAADADELTAADFGLVGPRDAGFVVRFRGFEDGGSDTVPAIPLPATGMMGGAALLALVMRRRRRA